MKKFFTVIPLQVPGQLSRYRYEPVGNTRLWMEDETSFPILTAIHGYVQPGEPFQVIAVVADSEVGRANCQALRQELETLCGKYGLTCAGVVEVTIPSDESVSVHAATFQKLIPYAEDDDELFACITLSRCPWRCAWRYSTPTGSSATHRFPASSTAKSTAPAGTRPPGGPMCTTRRPWCGWTRSSGFWQTGAWRTRAR